MFDFGDEKDWDVMLGNISVRVTDKFTFRFPKPGQLPGITSKGKAIMKMNDITFTYPGAEKAQLNNVSIQVSLSRVSALESTEPASRP